MEMTQFSSTSTPPQQLTSSAHNEETGESTFLCGYQKIRRYGSTNSDMASGSFPSSSSSSSLHASNISQQRSVVKLIAHQVEPTDTLQSLELRYNSSQFEIKRLNRLWSNASLHCKTHVNIPVFESDGAQRAEEAPHTGDPRVLGPTRLLPLERVDYSEESLNELFKRIDRNVKKTKKVVKKLEHVHDEDTLMSASR